MTRRTDRQETVVVLAVTIGVALLSWAGPADRTGDQARVGEESTRLYYPGFARPRLPDGVVGRVETGRPIILIIMDALRPDHLGCYGYQRDTSPVLDHLADEGILLTRFFANSSWTRPATTSILTGLIPTHHGVQCEKHRLAGEVTTVAERLKGAGYTTLAVVGNGNASSVFGLSQGFDVYIDTTTHWKGLPRANQVFRQGLELLRRHQGKKKIFLLLFVVDPHDPYRPSPPYDTMFMPDYHGKVVHSPHWEYQNDYPEKVRQNIIALYDGLIRFTDDRLGEFFAELRRLGWYERSSIFVTADHGEAFGEHGIYKHGYHLYETHIRVPLLIRAPWLPDAARGRYSPAFLQQIDLAPTFLELAGVSTPDDLPGISIIEALRSSSAVPAARYVVSEYRCYGIRRSAIRTRARKLIYQQPADREAFMKTVGDPKYLPSVSFDRETFELYDVLKDPRELTDIWPQAKPQLKQALLETLRDETDEHRHPRRVNELDPQLVEELRSLGYVY